MIVVTSGRLVRRKIETPRGERVRPTPSKVRAAVFDIVAHMRGELPSPVSHLDLFAGSGIMGIEATSRWGTDIVFVENYRSACQVIKKNLESLELGGVATLLPLHVLKALARLGAQDRRFDSIYMDPPYKETELRDTVISRVAELTLLSEHGVLMVEYQTRFPAPPENPAALRLLQTRRWGETMVNFYGREDSSLPGLL